MMIYIMMKCVSVYLSVTKNNHFSEIEMMFEMCSEIFQQVFDNLSLRNKQYDVCAPFFAILIRMSHEKWALSEEG